MHDHHPSQRDLELFCSGRLPLQQAADIEHHLASCDPCSQRLHDMHDESASTAAQDRFVSALKQALHTHREFAPLSESDTMLGSLHPTEILPNVPKIKGSKQIPVDLQKQDEYTILNYIGGGGMGAVFLAEHNIMKRRVALKVMQPEFMHIPGARDRFLQEVQAAAKLSHPHIVIAHDAEQVGELFYLVMEYVDGQDLRAIVDSQGPLPLQDACKYVSHAAVALDHAHELGLVHRDIKPQNLIRTPRDEIKLLDFGVAGFVGQMQSEIELGETPAELQDRLTQFGQMVGTTDYMAPEQWEDPRSVDTRSDIYSLGCTLYFVLTGHPPFPGGTRRDKRHRHRNEFPEPIQTVRNDVPAPLVQLVRRMMAKDPERRFTRPNDVATLLDELGNDLN